mgnify:CR=1 FL=1
MDKGAFYFFVKCHSPLQIHIIKIYGKWSFFVYIAKKKLLKKKKRLKCGLPHVRFLASLFFLDGHLLYLELIDNISRKGLYQ